jgi:hypothetical protein
MLLAGWLGRRLHLCRLADRRVLLLLVGEKQVLGRGEGNILRICRCRCIAKVRCRMKDGLVCMPLIIEFKKIVLFCARNMHRHNSCIIRSVARSKQPANHAKQKNEANKVLVVDIKRSL